MEMNDEFSRVRQRKGAAARQRAVFQARYGLFYALPVGCNPSADDLEKRQ